MIRFRAKNLPLKVLPVKLPARQLPVVIVTMKNRTLSQVLGIPRSSRLLNWSNSRRCRFAGHWRRSISRDRPSTTGTAAIKTVGSKLWRTASQDRGGSGTKSPTRSARRSSIWRLRSQTCRHGSSPSTSRTASAALCPRQRVVGTWNDDQCAVWDMPAQRILKRSGGEKIKFAVQDHCRDADR